MAAGARVRAGAQLCIAAVLAALALFHLQWFSSDYTGAPGNDGSFRNVHRAVTGPDGGGVVSYGFSAVYFGWLGYALGAAAVLTTLGYVLTRTRVARILAAAIAALALPLTLWALDLFTVERDSYVDVAGGMPPRTGYLDWLGRTNVGAWAMVLAFALCLVAVLVGVDERR